MAARRTPGKAESVVMMLSALSFGVLGWCAAHALTWWLLTHQHVVDPGETIRHSHGYLPSVAVTAGCVAAGTVLAVLAVARDTRRRCPRRWPLSRRRSLGRAAVLSTTVFPVTELAEHQLTGQQWLPTPWILLISLFVYALVGVATLLLWRSTADAVRAMAARLFAACALPSEAPAPPSRSTTAAALRRRRWNPAHAGRGPPALAV